MKIRRRERFETVAVECSSRSAAQAGVYVLLACYSVLPSHWRWSIPLGIGLRAGLILWRACHRQERRCREMAVRGNKVDALEGDCIECIRWVLGEGSLLSNVRDSPKRRG